MDLPDSGIKLGSPILQVAFLPTELSEKPTDVETEAVKVRDIGTPMGDSCCCLAATNTIL